MSVYDVHSAQQAIIYQADGQPLNTAFDVAENVVFQKGLKVCTYNIGGWYIGSGTNVPAADDASFYNLQNGIIADINADILCLEEYKTVFSQTGRTAYSLLSQYYPYIQTDLSSNNYMGRAICSKYPIKNWYTAIFPTASSLDNYYADATIEIANITIHVLVTHLSAQSSADRIAQAEELYTYISSQEYDKYFICGDYNSVLHDPFSEINAAIYNQFLNDGCSIANDGAFGILNTACNSADWNTDAFAIDNIIASEYFTIESVNTDLRKITDAAVLATGKIDHVPLYAMLTVS